MACPTSLNATPMAWPDDTEHQFYEALQRGDIDRLMSVRYDHDIACEAQPQVAWAIATNVYIQSMHRWRPGSHHASPKFIRETPDLRDSPSVLH